jgi:peptidoglycan/LPS O-acetylase OafA/YrhL
MEFKDFMGLLHPILAVAIVFPMLGVVLNMGWQTMQRRKQIAIDTKSKIPPVVGPEHVKAGRILSGSVVGVTLLGLAYPIFEHIWSEQVWSKNSFQVIFIVLMFVATVTSFVMLYRATPALWRGIFATLTGTCLVILGAQDGVYRRTNEWYWSHYYIGITAALLMVFSLAIIQDIYKDRSNRWRTIHVILNSIAVLLFLGQGMTGTRDLLEIPLNWQKPYIYTCDFTNKTCPKP